MGFGIDVLTIGLPIVACQGHSTTIVSTGSIRRQPAVVNLSLVT